MAVVEAAFNNEKELETWTFANSSDFFGACVSLSGFRITTLAGKHGVPDGFVFNFAERKWAVVECELLSHGVWPHIAEQITRFVVAIRNPATLRQIRDRLFRSILADGLQTTISNALSTSTERLLHEIELFVEGIEPSIAIFIDDTDQDLVDFCNALDAPTQVFRVKKLLVDGAVHYYSPDHEAPVVETDPSRSQQNGPVVFDTISRLGGGDVLSNRNKCFRLKNGAVVKVQYSKLHERNQTYWYGISPAGLDAAKAIGCTDFVFVMGDVGFVVVRIAELDAYLATAYTSPSRDGAIKHYHVHISPPPDVVLKGYGKGTDVDVSGGFVAFD